MKPSYVEALNDFVKSHCTKTKSIIVVGSHALGEERHGSDLDLIVIAKSRENARLLKEIVSLHNKNTKEYIIDCKIYTEKEFNIAKSGKENLFLWVALSNGKILFGKDIRIDIKLNPRLVVNSVWDLLQNLNKSIDLLEAKTQFTGCCYTLYQALVTSYFIERFVLQVRGSAQSKSVFINKMLGETYDVVRDRYYWVVNRITNPEIEGIVATPILADKRFLKGDYRSILNKCIDIQEYFRDVYSKIIKWAE